MKPIDRVASLWVGDKLSVWEQVCLQSFLHLGVSVDLYSYGGVENAPNGVNARDASEVVSESFVHENRGQPGTYAAFSNYFRYSLLKQRSVVWVDTDVYLLRPFQAVDSYVLGFEGFGRVNGAVLGYPADSPIADFLLTQSKTLLDSEVPWGTLGPKLITEGVRRHRLWSVVQGEDTFYPYPWRQSWRLFDPQEAVALKDLTRNSCAIHLWNEAIRNTTPGVKSRMPEKGSLAHAFITAQGVNERFSGHPQSTTDSSWQAWRQGLDPKNQGSTLSFRARLFLRGLPQPLLGWLNRLSLGARRALAKP